MTTEAFRSWKPNAPSYYLLQHAQWSLEDVPAQTLRHLFFDLVNRGILTDTVRDQKRLARVTAEARMAGLLDWDYLADQDDGRVVYGGHPLAVREVWVSRDSLLALTGDVMDSDMQLRARPVPIVRFRAFPSVSVLYGAYKRGAREVLVPVSSSDVDEDMVDDLTKRFSDFNITVTPIMFDGNDIERHSVEAYKVKIREALT